ncbi:MAG: hypothetical protein Q8M22_03635 [Actinomycetota bacterium]|nr:hypothetical protein [Actinomycetota bacterium]
MQPSGGNKPGIAAAVGAAAVAVVLVLAGVGLHASPVAAAGQVNVQASGSAAALAGVQIGLIDAFGVDMAPVYCEVDAAPTLLRLTCLDLPDGSYRPTLVAPATGVGFTSWCSPTDADIEPEPDGSARIRDGVAQHLCTMNVFPTDGSGEVSATLVAHVAVPFGLASVLTYQYLDELGNDRFTEYCTTTTSSDGLTIDCAGHAAGSYRLAVADLPAGAYSRYQCVAENGPGLPSPTDIRITTATGFIRCDWAIGPPTVRIRVHDADVNGTIDGVQVNLRRVGGAAVPCSHPSAAVWECSGLPSGRYEVTSNLAALGTEPLPLQCIAAPTYESVAATPIVVADISTVQFTRCVLAYRVPQRSTVTTALASGAGGQSSAGLLPSVGGEHGVAMVAALFLIVGGLMSAATRRPVR